MQMRLHLIKRKFVFFYCCLTLCFTTGMSTLLWANSAVPKSCFNSLKERLVQDGYDSYRIDQIYSDPAVAFELKGVSSYFVHNESKLNYNQFSSPKMIDKARNYMRKYELELDAAQKKFGVDPEVITAIMLIETRLGSYVGRNSILAILSTMAIMTDSEPREIVWEALPEDRRYSRDAFDKKADVKAQWAYRELKAFLTYTAQSKMDPVSIVGSYAGAMGIAQFMPSNILAYGDDGNKDGQINLFNHADAISSIGSYLKHFGWRPGISREEAAKVVYHYNHSHYYVNAVLKIADLLKQT